MSFRKTILEFFPVWALASSLLFSCAVPDDSGSEEILGRLDGILASKDVYENYFHQRIAAIKELSTMGGDSYVINKRIADAYSAYNLDSTILYLEKNLELSRAEGDASRLFETQMLMAREYGRAGDYSDALELVEKYDDVPVADNLDYSVYEALYYLYGELAYYSSNKQQWWDKRAQISDILLTKTPENSYSRYNILRIQAESNQDHEAALGYAMKALEVSPMDSRQYAEACFFVASYLDDKAGKIEYFARSAMADVMCANKDYASLLELSTLLYEMGDTERAFKYLGDHCLPDALVFNGKLRPWQIARVFPEIEKAYAEKNSRVNAIIRFLMAASLVLLAVLALLIWSMNKRQKALMAAREELQRSKEDIEKRNSVLSQMNDELHESNKVRQEYIILFLKSLSEILSRDRTYKNHVLKYLKRGHEKYLIEEIELSQPNEDIRSFNKMFDDTFIKLYPTFVEKFNALLLPGQQEEPKGGDLLTPEMRVFALIRLGITDSVQIASLLHYSPNTIYNYRAKIKNKAACDRDAFEDAVKAIE